MVSTSAATLEECRHMQHDEILALESIYNHELLGDVRPEDRKATQPSFTVESHERDSPPVLCFRLPGVLPRPASLSVRSVVVGAAAEDGAAVSDAGRNGRSRCARSALKPTASSFEPRARPGEREAEGEAGPSVLVDSLAGLRLGPSSGKRAQDARSSASRNDGSVNINGAGSREQDKGHGRRRRGNGQPQETRARPDTGSHSASSAQKDRRGKGPKEMGRTSDPASAGSERTASRATAARSLSVADASDTTLNGVQRSRSRPEGDEIPELPPEALAAVNGSVDARKEAVPLSHLARTQKLPQLMHLPPVTLRVRLPPDYPLAAPPEVLTLQATWLPSAAGSPHPSAWIRQRLQEQYDELGGSEVLWSWAQWLSEGMWQDLFTSTGAADLPFVVDTSPDASSASRDELARGLEFCEHLASAADTPVLAAALLSHSRLCMRSNFDSASFDCGICLENRKGRRCTKLEGCGHVFCSECLVAYLYMLVDEGFHRQAKRCPDPECVQMRGEMEKRGEDPDLDAVSASQLPTSATAAGRAESEGPSDANGATASPRSSAVAAAAPAVRGSISRRELETLLTAEQLDRLDRLTLKARMESDPSITYCPRAGCQAAVLRKPGDDGIWEKFRECPACGMAFCAWCSRSWHGANACPVSFQADLVERYRSLGEGSAGRRQMELAFGRKTLETLVQRYEEEEETRRWMREFTTPCPGCAICIEKSFGCNHMTCQSCRTHYCYLCGKSISATNPYQHFNTPGAGCYNRLFDGVLANGAELDEQGRPLDMADMIPWHEIL